MRETEAMTTTFQYKGRKVEIWKVPQIGGTFYYGCAENIGCTHEYSSRDQAVEETKQLIDAEDGE